MRNSPIGRAVGWTFGPALEVWSAYGRLFVLIQGAAALVLAAWFLSPAVRGVAEVLAGWKADGGWAFAGTTAMISGGVVPELLKWKFRPPHLPAPGRVEVLHQFALFALSGVMVNGFYQLQSDWFGEGSVLVKVAVDQLVYSPLIAAPVAVLWFLWRERGFSVRATVRAATPGLLVARVVPMWSTGLLFWTPLLFLLYALPGSLQFIAFLFAYCAWGIILVFIGRRQIGTPGRTADP